MQNSDYDLHLEELMKGSVHKLFQIDVFDLGAFNQLYEYLCNKSELIKDDHVVSKQVMSCIFQAQRRIENTAEFNSVVKDNIEFANKFALLLELIANGEAPNDRKPGVPRIF
jgi:hypothetical protein